MQSFKKTVADRLTIIYPRETDGFISANTYTQMFTAGLFLVAQSNKIHMSLPETQINCVILRLIDAILLMQTRD